MALSNWAKEWPEKAGSYWFYGWIYGRDGINKGSKPELRYVVVRISGNDIPMYIAGGHFMFKGEQAEGFWLEVDLPNLPKLV